MLDQVRALSRSLPCVASPPERACPNVVGKMTDAEFIEQFHTNRSALFSAQIFACLKNGQNVIFLRSGGEKSTLLVVDNPLPL